MCIEYTRKAYITFKVMLYTKIELQIAYTEFQIISQDRVYSNELLICK